MKKAFRTLWAAAFLTSVSSASLAMDQREMEKIVKNMAEVFSGGEGMVQFEYKGVRMLLISDVNHNRMRIISPVAEYSTLEKKHIDAIMSANFHAALDARYALSQDTLYSAYIHPLAELTIDQLQSAVEQVANLSLSFGNEYSSGTLSFGQPNQEDTEKPAL